MILPYPHIDPVLVHLGPLAIRWYALSYIAGLLLGWWYLVQLIRTPSLWQSPTFGGHAPATVDDIGDLLVWTTLGVIIGGRLGYVLIYGTFFCGIWGISPACAGLPRVIFSIGRWMSKGEGSGKCRPTGLRAPRSTIRPNTRSTPIGCRRSSPDTAARCWPAAAAFRSWKAPTSSTVSW